MKIQRNGSTLTLIHEDDEGFENEVIIPSKFEVCPRCEGHGTHLHSAIGEHAYSPEEFNESFFEDDEREAYFTRGGRYDVQCEECHGARVLLMPDEDRMSQETKDILEKHYRDEAEYAAECRMERLMGC